MTNTELIEQAVLDRVVKFVPESQEIIFPYKGLEYRYSTAIEFKSGVLFLPRVQYHKRRKIDTNTVSYKLTRIAQKDIDGIWRAIRKLQKRIEDFIDFEKYKNNLLDEIKPKLIEFLLEDDLSIEDINKGKFILSHEFWIYRSITKSASKITQLKLYSLECTFTSYPDYSRRIYTFDIKHPNRWWYKEVKDKKITLNKRVITYQKGLPLINVIRYARLKKIANVE